MKSSIGSMVQASLRDAQAFPTVIPWAEAQCVFSPQLPMRQERGLQAASPSALADRKGICQGPLDCPTRKRRKRRAPLACATATLNKYEAHGYHHAVAPRLLDKRDARSERRT